MKKIYLSFPYAINFKNKNGQFDYIICYQQLFCYNYRNCFNLNMFYTVYPPIIRIYYNIIIFRVGLTFVSHNRNKIFMSWQKSWIPKKLNKLYPYGYTYQRWAYSLSIHYQIKCYVNKYNKFHEKDHSSPSWEIFRGTI